MNFPNQREYMLLQNVIGAIESGDEEAFSDHLFQFSQVNELDKWKVQLFLHIKNSKFFVYPFLDCADGCVVALIQARPPVAAAAQWSPDAPPPQGPVGDDGEVDLS
jgi:hypothetical protein